MITAKHALFQLRLASNISKYQAHRTNIVKEILSTEETYVKDLETIIRVTFSLLLHLLGLLCFLYLTFSPFLSLLLLAWTVFLHTP